MTSNPQLFWGLIASMWIGNLMLVVLNLPMIGVWIKLLTVPYRMLYPAILLFCAIGVYTVNNTSFDVMQTAFFGFLGVVFMRRLRPGAVEIDARFIENDPITLRHADSSVFRRLSDHGRVNAVLRRVGNGDTRRAARHLHDRTQLFGEELGERFDAVGETNVESTARRQRHLGERD